MINYFNPNNTLKIINKIQKFVFALFIIVLLLGLVEALVLSPEDYKQSDSVRIMYVHVPAAWISLGIFTTISVLSFGILIFKNKNLITNFLKLTFATSFIYLLGMVWLGSLIGWDKPIFKLGAQPFLLAELFKILIATLTINQIIKIRNLI